MTDVTDVTPPRALRLLLAGASFAKISPLRKDASQPSHLSLAMIGGPPPVTEPTDAIKTRRMIAEMIRESRELAEML